MALNFGDNIDYRGKKPLDGRVLFEKKSNMASYNENYLPNLSIAQCEEDGGVYLYNKDNKKDLYTGKWRKIPLENYTQYKGTILHDELPYRIDEGDVYVIEDSFIANENFVGYEGEMFKNGTAFICTKSSVNPYYDRERVYEGGSIVSKTIKKDGTLSDCYTTRDDIKYMYIKVGEDIPLLKRKEYRFTTNQRLSYLLIAEDLNPETEKIPVCFCETADPDAPWEFQEDYQPTKADDFPATIPENFINKECYFIFSCNGEYHQGPSDIETSDFSDEYYIPFQFRIEKKSATVVSDAVLYPLKSPYSATEFVKFEDLGAPINNIQYELTESFVSDNRFVESGVEYKNGLLKPILVKDTIIRKMKQYGTYKPYVDYSSNVKFVSFQPFYDERIQVGDELLYENSLTPSVKIIGYKVGNYTDRGTYYELDEPSDRVIIPYKHLESYASDKYLTVTFYFDSTREYAYTRALYIIRDVHVDEACKWHVDLLGGGNDKTKLSEFEDDLGDSPIHTHNQYVTEEDIPTIPTKVSELENDSNFITEDDLPAEKTKLSEFEDDLGNSPEHTHNQYLTEHQSLDGYAKSTDVPKINAVQIGGKLIAEVTVNGKKTNLYAPSYNEIDNAQQYIFSATDKYLCIDGAWNDSVFEIILPEARYVVRVIKMVPQCELEIVSSIVKKDLYNIWGIDGLLIIQKKDKTVMTGTAFVVGTGMFTLSAQSLDIYQDGVSAPKNFYDAKAIIDLVYPIGSFYISTKSTSPETLFGGKWLQHSGYILRGATSGVVANSAAKTGGNDNMIIPYHNHSVNAVSITSSGTHNHANWKYDKDGASGTAKNRANGAGGTTASQNLFAAASGGHTHTVPAHNTNYAGTSGNTTNANLPNYKSVYMWERIG